MRVFLAIPVILAALLAGPGVIALTSAHDAADWRTASRASAGLAPDPATTPEAVVQVYAARAFKWRGAFAVHSWIAVKPAGAAAYTVYEVTGWAVRRGGRAVQDREAVPDRRWYGAQPAVLADLRGPAAAAAIGRIAAAVAAYPYPDSYTTWPGPNSNTFVAHVLRQVPELRADLPPTAIGKDYLPGPAFAAVTPSGTGGQLSLFGLAGIAVGLEEGIEINILGLGIGIDPGELALRLPGLGTVGLNTGAATARR
jgi:hypothetical protein